MDSRYLTWVFEFAGHVGMIELYTNEFTTYVGVYIDKLLMFSTAGCV
jgi:hypothetical protein